MLMKIPGIQGTITELSLGVDCSGAVIQDKKGVDHLYMLGKGE